MLALRKERSAWYEPIPFDHIATYPIVPRCCLLLLEVVFVIVVGAFIVCVICHREPQSSDLQQEKMIL